MTDVGGTVAAVAATPEKSLWHYLGIALSGALLLLVAALAVMLIVVPKVTGATPLTVLTNSMAPGLPPGTLIVIRPTDADELRIGDVATYQMRAGESAVITHRIIAISSSSAGGRTFTFKGDNNGVEDSEPVVEERIRGRLWYSLPFIGYVNNALGVHGKAWAVPAAAVLLLAYSGYMIASGTVAAAKTRRSKKSAAEADADEPARLE